MNRLIFALILALSSVAFAGDEPVTQVAYTGTQGCTAALQTKTRYAVQCTTDCYVRVTKSTSGQAATAATSVKLAQDKLYDVYTTNTKVYICALQVSSGGNLKVFVYEDR